MSEHKITSTIKQERYSAIAEVVALLEGRRRVEEQQGRTLEVTGFVVEEDFLKNIFFGVAKYAVVYDDVKQEEFLIGGIHAKTKNDALVSLEEVVKKKERELGRPLDCRDCYVQEDLLTSVFHASGMYR